mmetsp:Transcript_18224/g.21076  ORF Transcript_18224/g.21076 Transcript_18224/m.21076 type:complete len:336 (-) Transcript_18224:57-1064(-)
MADAAPKATTREDRELLELLTKLYTIQEDVGAKPKSTADDKLNRAANSSAMLGKGKAAKKAGMKFVETKSSCVQRLKKIHEIIQEEADRSKLSASAMAGVLNGGSAKDSIVRQAAIRDEIQQAEAEWQELDRLYKNEARKRKSKFTQEQLDVQQTFVQRLYGEVEKVKELNRAGYTRGNRDDIVATLNTNALNNIALDKQDAGQGWTGNGGGGGFADVSSGPGVELTQQQALELEQIESRDQEFDKQLDQIGEGIQDLAEIAQMQNEEVRRQNVMLDNVGNKITNAHDHIANVNTKMKETLDEVRAADKICVDIMCIMIMVGLGAVLYQMIKSQG